MSLPTLNVFGYLGYFWSQWIPKHPNIQVPIEKIHVLPLPLTVNLIGATLNVRILKNCAGRDPNYIEPHQLVLFLLKYLHVYGFMWFNLPMYRDTYSCSV